MGIEGVFGAAGALERRAIQALAIFDPASAAARLDNLNSRGLSCFPTFTNHLLESGDLGDPACNLLLDTIALRPHLNAVIVNSELLSRYIAGRHPGLRQIASVTKVVAEGGRGNAALYNEGKAIPSLRGPR